MYQFTETQRFRQWWLWLIMILSVSPILITWFVQSSNGKNISSLEIVALSVTPVMILLLFATMNLKTGIDSSGIHYRFFPLQWKERIILWDEIETVQLRKYRPLGEYGGWGLRYSFKYGKAVNVSGDKGLQLVLKNGKKILIGTNKWDEMEEVLRGLGKV